MLNLKRKGDNNDLYKRTLGKEKNYKIKFQKNKC